MKEIEKKILKSGLIKNNTTIILGFSGGPDSLALLHILNENKEKFNLNIIPVHINHKLRENAYIEALKAKKMCENMGLEMMSFAVDCNEFARKEKISTEMAGRCLRYKYFHRVAKKIENAGIKKENIFVAVAHNMDDDVETILHRIIRGTGIGGLRGIEKSTVNEFGDNVIRPILKVKRSEIEAYLKENNLKANIDETNKTEIYLRNKIRINLLPYIREEFNEAFDDALLRLSEIAEAEDNVIQNLAEQYYLKYSFSGNSSIEFFISDLTCMERGLLYRIFIIALKELGVNEGQSYKMMENINKTLLSEIPSCKIHLMDDIFVKREYERLIIYRETKNKKSKIKLDISVGKYFEKNKENTAIFSFDKLKEKYGNNVVQNINIRKRQEGDFIKIKNGTKKLQDVFVDMKLPKDQRDDVNIVAIGSEILWIMPNEFMKNNDKLKRGRFSQNYQQDNKSETSVFIEVLELI